MGEDDSGSSSSEESINFDMSHRSMDKSERSKKSKKSKKEKKKKKDKKKKKSKGGGGGDGDEFEDDIGLPDLPEKGQEDGDAVPKSAKPGKDKKHKKKAKMEGMTDELDALNLASPRKMVKIKSSRLNASMADLDLGGEDELKLEEYSAGYFEDILAEAIEKFEKKVKIKSKDNSKFLEALGIYYDTWFGKWENEQWLNDLLDNKGSPEEIAEAQGYVDESKEALPANKKYCVKMALKIFEKLDMDKLAGLEAKLVKGAIIAQATPEALAEFASDRTNEKYIKKLFKDPKLMKDMLRHGGARNYKYGNAMKIYYECMEDTKNTDEYWERLHKKIALACALELCDTMYEFDSSVPIDAVARFKHFRDAHQNGELDPAFPFFSVWEMRSIVNCDAPNDQLKWCRQMVMNYVPYMTVLTDNKVKYTYITDSDVRIRKPTWTGSPRTYQMVLSGGGNQSVNAWFGRFVLNAFGLPTWGSKKGRQDGYARWTPEGWVSIGEGFEWDNIQYQGKTGLDFKMETEARCKAPPEEYFLKLVMLQCLGDIIDGNTNEIPEYERDVLHPERFWRSLSLISLTLLFETEPEVKRTFERKGNGLVVTNVEKYLEKYELDFPESPIKYEDGVITIPPSAHGFCNGNTMVVESFTAGKQLLFIADGAVEYEVPDDAPTKKYKLTMEVCTVSAKQSMLTMHMSPKNKSVRMKIPYTVGEWKTTDPVEFEIESGSTLKFSRPKNSLGLGIKKFILTAVEEE